MRVGVRVQSSSHVQLSGTKRGWYGARVRIRLTVTVRARVTVIVRVTIWVWGRASEG